MPTIRLDKLLSQSLIISRKDASSIIKSGRVKVLGFEKRLLPDTKIDTDKCKIFLDGKEISFCENIYIMLNKPAGLICATQDKKDNTVLSLFDKNFLDKGLFSCGRLDKDTVGLLIMTTDGALSHKLLSPKHHAAKKYFVRCDKPFEEKDILLFKNGIMMDGKMTKPSILEISVDNPFEAFVTLTEGKYHEIKRLCYACSQKEVVYLKRIEFAGLTLDETLSEGEWRYLSDEETNTLKSNN